MSYVTRERNWELIIISSSTIVQLRGSGQTGFSPSDDDRRYTQSCIQLRTVYFTVMDKWKKQAWMYLMLD